MLSRVHQLLCISTEQRNENFGSSPRDIPANFQMVLTFCFRGGLWFFE